MGLLTSQGIPDGETKETTRPATSALQPPTGAATDVLPSPLVKWHPSPPALRRACKKLAPIAAAHNENLETIAVRWALGEWTYVGGAARLGTLMKGLPAPRMGVTVVGVKTIEELEATLKEYRGAISSLWVAYGETNNPEEMVNAKRQDEIAQIVQKEMWPSLGDEWLDYRWDSPGDDFVNKRAQASSK
jgi:hypothetical protein